MVTAVTCKYAAESMVTVVQYQEWETGEGQGVL